MANFEIQFQAHRQPRAHEGEVQPCSFDVPVHATVRDVARLIGESGFLNLGSKAESQQYAVTNSELLFRISESSSTRYFVDADALFSNFLQGGDVFFLWPKSEREFAHVLLALKHGDADPFLTLPDELKSSVVGITCAKYLRSGDPSHLQLAGELWGGDSWLHLAMRY